ncbi:MAG: tRNA lysidine(34) synthetase TilS [Bdellovibrio sp.]
MKLTSEKRDLDHHVWKILKLHGLQTKKILVALSGGVDSVALLRVLTKVHKKDRLGVCYFHHGEDSNQEYRREALVFCEKLCKKLEVDFFPLQSHTLAKSEQEYREQRYEALTYLQREEGFDCIATGHHRDDLLETRLMRLIRGTGAQGFQAMTVYQESLLRPFLEVSKKDLKKYVREEKLRVFEDPSNASLDPLRNWVRGEWLKSLEKRSRGATASLARSLETIAQEIENRPWGDLLSQNEAYKTQGLSRGFYLTLSPFEQKRLLAQYLFALKKKDFSQSHLEEIQKRLDKSQKVITFKVGGCHWEVNAEQIKVQS